MAETERFIGDGKSASRPGPEQEICKKYAKIIGREPTGLTDTLRILTGPEILPLLEEYIAEMKAEDERLYKELATRKPER